MDEIEGGPEQKYIPDQRKEQANADREGVRVGTPAAAPVYKGHAENQGRSEGLRDIDKQRARKQVPGEHQRHRYEDERGEGDVRGVARLWGRLGAQALIIAVCVWRQPRLRILWITL